MPRVRIGDDVIIGAGAVVTKDVSSNSIIAGNPAHVISSGINMSSVCRKVEYQRLSVAMVNNYLHLRGGSERVMFDESHLFDQVGHNVVYFGRSSENDQPFIHSDLFPPVNDFSTLHGVRKLTGARNVIRNGQTANRFAMVIDRVRPDIVHGHNIYGGLTTSILDVCLRKKMPFILTLHDYKLVCPSYVMLNHGQVCNRCVGGNFFNCLLSACHKNSRAVSMVSTIEAYFNQLFGKYLQADYLIAPSRFLMEKMLSHGIPAKKLLCIPNGLDPIGFEPFYNDEGYVLYMGRISREKGIDTLLEAVVGSGVDTRIVGDGPEMKRLSGDLLEKGVTNVSFLGYQQGEKLRDLMRGAMFIVVPSEWYENASMTVLESMAYGKAVIASRIGGIPEQIVDGETGLLFEAGNIQQLRDAILSLVSDKTRRIEMGRAGRARLESRFSLDRHCQSLLKVYQAAINKEIISQSDLD